MQFGRIQVVNIRRIPITFLTRFMGPALGGPLDHFLKDLGSIWCVKITSKLNKHHA